MGFIQRLNERTKTNESIIKKLQSFQKLTYNNKSMAKSKKMKFNKANGIKVLKGAGIATGGALLIYLAELLPNVDFGTYTPLVVAIGGILINAVKEYLSDK